MKYTLIALLVILNSTRASAQQHILYTDVGYALSRPGFSATYNYKLTKNFSTGIGVQGYKMYRPLAKPKFTPGLFADMRINIRPGKKNQFFVLLDLGIDFYKQDKSYHRDSTALYIVPHNNGFYIGLGIGYFRRMTKRGGGPYVSLKLACNTHTYWRYSIVSEKKDTGLFVLDGNLPFSLGFKF